MTWDDASSVLQRWAGSPVVIVPFLLPGISLTPFAGPLVVSEPRSGVLRVRVEPDEEPVVEPVRPVRNLWPAEPVPDDFLEPVQPHDPRRGTYDRPMVNSYPHVRGFDD